MTEYSSDSDTLDLKSYKIIALEGLSTAGYLWEYEVSNQKIIKVEDIPNTDRSKINSDVCGTSYDELFKITAIGLGTTTVLFRQVRPWEISPPIKKHMVTITVV